ncbi:MAG: nuclear transport factor 2 family protein [Thermoanaerobaculia bacterium]
MKVHSVFYAAVLVAGAATAHAATPVEDLVAAERAFAHASVETNVKDSFLAVLALDSVVFRPGPVNGRDWYGGRPAPAISLSWQPIAAEASAAGDLGYTTGPWEISAHRGEAATAFGTYLSVWRHSGDHWELLVDDGVDHPKLGTPPVPWAPGPPPARWSPGAGRANPGVVEQAMLLAADADLGRIRPDAAANRAKALAPGARLLRDGSVPLVEKSAVEARLGSEAARLGWKPDAGGVASSGDFGYTYGQYQLATGSEAGAKAETGHYLRIWRRAPSGAWLVLVDLLSADPAK